MYNVEIQDGDHTYSGTFDGANVGGALARACKEFDVDPEGEATFSAGYEAYPENGPFVKRRAVSSVITRQNVADWTDAP